LHERLDEAKLDQLRAWGSGLSAHESPDVRATGKAILMLIEEIERLHVDVWNAKAASAAGSPKDEREPGSDVSTPPEAPDELASTLRQRLARLRRLA
jgi:hypothetical protein